MTDNYITVVVSPESRRLHGALNEYYYPFSNRDTKSITKAQLAAEAKRRELERNDIEVVLACWRYCDFLDLPVIGAAYGQSHRATPRNGGWARIGEVA